MSARGIRVLHCIHSLSGGGAERQLGLLASASGRHDMDAAIFCLENRANDVAAAVPIYRGRRRHRLDLAIFRSLHASMKDFKPDVVHAWLPASMTIPTMLVAASRSIPCVYSYRNAMSFHRLLTIPEYLVAAFVATRVVSNNAPRRSTGLYRLLFDIKRGVRIDNAVSVGVQRVRTCDIRPDGPWNVLFVGRLTRQKNWQCLLRALALLEPPNRVRVAICGDGEDCDLMMSMAQALGVQGSVSYLGYRHDVHELMCAADMLVLPSWWEGMPNVLLEALAIGLPCVVSDIPAHRDIIGDRTAALMFDPADPAALADRICTLRDDSTIGRQVEQEGRKLSEMFSVERMARAYYAVYSTLLEDVPRVTSSAR